MTNVQLPDDLAEELVVMTGKADVDAAVLQALGEYMQYRKQLRVLDFEGQFDADPSFDYKEQRRIP